VVSGPPGTGKEDFPHTPSVRLAKLNSSDLMPKPYTTQTFQLDLSGEKLTR